MKKQVDIAYSLCWDKPSVAKFMAIIFLSKFCIPIYKLLLSDWAFSIWTGINDSESYSDEWYRTEAVLRVSLGNFLFFAILSLIMIGVKDQNDTRDSWQHGGWMAKIIIWALLIILVFFFPNALTSFYG